MEKLFEIFTKDFPVSDCVVKDVDNTYNGASFFWVLVKDEDASEESYTIVQMRPFIYVDEADNVYHGWTERSGMGYDHKTTPNRYYGDTEVVVIGVGGRV